jgi:hypothetical protein
LLFISPNFIHNSEGGKDSSLELRMSTGSRILIELKTEVKPVLRQNESTELSTTEASRKNYQ